MQGHENTVDEDETQPEVHFAEGFVHHAAPHFRKPVVEAGKSRKYGGEAHGEMEMAHHEAGGVQIGIDRRLRQEKATDSSADEERDETEAEQHRSGKAYVGAVEREGEHQHRNDRGDRDDERRYR